MRIGDIRLHKVGCYLSSKHEGSSYRTHVLCKVRGIVQSALDDISFYMKQANDLAIHASPFIDLEVEGREKNAPNLKIKQKMLIVFT